MNTAKVIIAAAILTIASTSFAGTKCSQRLSFGGNSLLKNTVAPSSVEGTKTASTAAVKSTR